MAKPAILFMGTPEFAVPSLEALVRAGYPVVGVVTQPDRPKGRGKHLAPPPAKVRAEELGIEVFQPERIRDAAFMETLHRLRPDLVAVAAFGQILPRPFWKPLPGLPQCSSLAAPEVPGSGADQLDPDPG